MPFLHFSAFARFSKLTYKEIFSFYETFPERMSLKKFGHALTKFDQISVMGRRGGVAIWWWVLWQHGCVPLRTENDSDKSAVRSSGENAPGRRI